MAKDRENSRRIAEQNEAKRTANKVKSVGGTRFVFETLEQTRAREAREAQQRRSRSDYAYA
jgi:hypothetical protein